MVFHSRGRPFETTVGEVDADSEHVAGALHHLGVRPGTVVGVMLPTWYATAVAYHAVLKLGAVLLPMVTIFGSSEMAFVLNQSRAKALVIPDRWRDHDYVERLQQAGNLPHLEHVLVVGANVPRGMLSWDAMVAEDLPDYPRVDIDADAVCAVIFTSGTTSAPKGVQHTHNTLLADIGPRAYRDAGRPLPGKTVFLNCWAPGHIGGLFYLIQPFMFGTPTIYMDQWVPEEAAELIERYRVTTSGGTPVFLTTLLAAADRSGRDLSSLVSFGLGGAAVTPAHVALAERLGFRCGRGYGSTEHPTISTPPADADFQERAHTDGKVTPLNEIRILDEQGNDLPTGQDGEIVSRGPELFVGYLDEELDLDAIMEGGWFRTGDIGHLDADGFLTITDRKKDIIIRGGENISSKAVEDVLAQHPAVFEVAVTAMPDPIMGEKVCAFVTLRRGSALSLDEVRAHFRERGVAVQKTPEKLLIVEDFPRTASGKVKKFELRNRLRDSREEDVPR